MKNKVDKVTTAGGAETVIVSSCLLGLPARYDGGDSKSNELIARLSGKVVIAVCPEGLGGLPTPRPAAEIKAGNDNADAPYVPDVRCVPDGSSVLDGSACVTTSCGEDVTASFIRGAEECLSIARINQVSRAYLKEKSPSCGVSIIKKDGTPCAGSGVTAELLKRNNIETTGCR